MTVAFIDEIIANPDKYNCLPLYVDIDRLKARDYRALGHMLNRVSGRFRSTQVGSMRDFRKVEDEYGVSLIGEARIPKREQVVCDRVMELYDMGDLNFSFELRYTEDHVIVKDGVTYVDAAEHNVLTGMAIVSVPAYQEAFALSLVAEDQTETEVSTDEMDKGVETMDKAENIVTEQTVAEEVIVSEETKPEENTQQAVAEEAVAQEATEAVAEEATAEEAVAEEAAAEAITAEEDVTEEDEKPEDSEEEKPDEDDKDDAKENNGSGRTVAELEMALAQTEADWAAERAQYMALEAEVADLRACKAALDAEIERLHAIEAELAAINAAKEAEELARKQEQARAFAQKQGLDVAQTVVASAIESLDYAKIAELAMEQEPAIAETVVSVASYATTEPMKIKSRFENVLKRVSE